MPDEPSRWQSDALAVEADLRAWRAAHPDATLTEIEAALDARLRGARAGLLVDVAAGAPDGDADRCPACGERLVRRGERTRTLRTQARRRWRCGGRTCPARRAKPGFSPLDERLGLRPGSALTPWLVESIARLRASLPFARAAELLAHFTGVTVGAETVRRLTEAAGAAQVAVETAAVAELERALPDAPAGPAVQGLSADGAMVPLRGRAWAEVKTLAVGEVVAGADEPRTTALSYFSRLADAATFGRLATAETHRRGTAAAGTVVAVADGAEWLQGFVDLHWPDAVRVLDFPHAVEHLGAAAQAAFGPGTGAASEWLGRQAHALRHGAEEGVLTALTELAAAPGLGAEARATVAGAGAYLATRREHVRYQAFVAAGYRSAAAAWRAPTSSWSGPGSRTRACTGRGPTSTRCWRSAPCWPTSAGRRRGPRSGGGSAPYLLMKWLTPSSRAVGRRATTGR